MRLRLSFFTPVLLTVAAQLALAQSGGRDGQEHVRNLNNRLLQLHQSMKDAGSANTLELRNNALQLIRQRATLLSTLMVNDPEAANAIVFSAEAVQELASTFPAASAYLETPGEWEGPAEYVVLDEATLKSSKSSVTLRSGGKDLEIHFAGNLPENLKCGAVLHVKGVRVGAHVLASLTPEVTSLSTASGGCSTTGQQNIAVILVTFPGVTPPITASAVYNVFFGSARSVNNYWRDASFGLTSATGNVFGWYTLPTSYTCDQYQSLATAAIAAADPDVFFPSYNRIFYVFPKPSGCTYGGISTVGCTSISSADGTFTASNSWLIADYLAPNDQGVELAVHEGGHGLTLNHAQSRGFAPYALGALNTSGTFSEYGDNFDPMGYYNLGHYGTQHKLQLGWIPASNVLTVQGSGTYNIAPWGTQTSAVQALKVQRGAGNPDWLWIEYHQPVGNYESALSSQIYSGATIRYQDAYTGSGYSNLLDFTPADGSFMDPALPANSTWTDPYTNLGLTVNSATPTALNIAVNFGAVPCTHSNPTVTLTPSNPAVNPGASVGYTITVLNNDSSTCAANGYTLSSVVPSGWAMTLPTQIVNLMPGQSTSVSMTTSVPMGATPGTYPISATAATSTNASTAAASCSVMAPGSASLSASILSQSGPDASRDWKLQVFDSGTATAFSTQITNITIVQTGGKTCSPYLITGMPFALGNIAPGQSVTTDVFFNFSGCDNSAKFTVDFMLSANGGATATTVVRNNLRK